jgi:hypothetical protein
MRVPYKGSHSAYQRPSAEVRCRADTCLTLACKPPRGALFTQLSSQALLTLRARRCIAEAQHCACHCLTWWSYRRRNECVWSFVCGTGGHRTCFCVFCRFCDQCSTFHPLSAYDGDRRTCREKLEHNRNKRKVRREGSTVAAPPKPAHLNGEERLIAATAVQPSQVATALQAAQLQQAVRGVQVAHFAQALRLTAVTTQPGRSGPAAELSSAPLTAARAQPAAVERLAAAARPFESPPSSGGAAPQQPEQRGAGSPGARPRTPPGPVAARPPSHAPAAAAVTPRKRLGEALWETPVLGPGPMPRPIAARDVSGARVRPLLPPDLLTWSGAPPAALRSAHGLMATTPAALLSAGVEWAQHSYPPVEWAQHSYPAAPSTLSDPVVDTEPHTGASTLVDTHEHTHAHTRTHTHTCTLMNTARTRPGVLRLGVAAEGAQLSVLLGGAALPAAPGQPPRRPLSSPVLRLGAGHDAGGHELSHGGQVRALRLYRVQGCLLRGWRLPT